MIILTLQIALLAILVEIYYLDAKVLINICMCRETITGMEKTYYDNDFYIFL